MQANRTPRSRERSRFRRATSSTASTTTGTLFRPSCPRGGGPRKTGTRVQAEVLGAPRSLGYPVWHARIFDRNEHLARIHRWLRRKLQPLRGAPSRGRCSHRAALVLLLLRSQHRRRRALQGERGRDERLGDGELGHERQWRDHLVLSATSAVGSLLGLLHHEAARRWRHCAHDGEAHVRDDHVTGPAN
jgi:hypothetical protein